MFSLSLVSSNFLISLLISSVTCRLFRNVLFNLHVLLFLTVFSCNWYLVSEKMFDTVSIFLNFLRFDLLHKMWSILENVPCALEKKVYSSAFGWNVLKISMRSISSNVSFKMCFFIDFLLWWSVDCCEWGVKVSYYYCVTVTFSFYVC